MLTRVLVLNQVGNEVHGTITPETNRWTTGPFHRTIYGGKVHEDGTISFYIWYLRDEPVKQVYKGQISADGQETIFTVTTGEDFPPPTVKALIPLGERNARWPDPFKVAARRSK